MNKIEYVMNGSKFLLDTNAIIALLKGNNYLVRLLQDADWVGISIINHIEFLAFSNLSRNDIDLFNRFIQRVEVIGLPSKDYQLIDLIIFIRQQYNLKLPDSIIAGVAIQNNAILVTADRDFVNINNLKVLNFIPLYSNFSFNNDVITKNFQLFFMICSFYFLFLY